MAPIFAAVSNRRAPWRVKWTLKRKVKDMSAQIILFKSAATRPGNPRAANGSTSIEAPSTIATTAQRVVAFPVKTKD